MSKLTRPTESTLAGIIIQKSAEIEAINSALLAKFGNPATLHAFQALQIANGFGFFSEINRDQADQITSAVFEWPDGAAGLLDEAEYDNEGNLTEVLLYRTEETRSIRLTWVYENNLLISNSFEANGYDS